MKKLMMFAAAMTIVGGAFAQCADIPVVTNNCALVYDVKLSVKTTVPKAIAGSTINVPCADEETVAEVCYRTPGSLTLKGYLQACACDCESFLAATLTLWDTHAKAYVTVDSFAWDFLNVIGKKNTEAEGAWTMEIAGGTLYGAGFGKWDGKATPARLSSMSGNFAGSVSAPQCDSEITCDAAIAYPCGNFDQGSSTLETAAYGTWSIKYNKSLSKKEAAGEELPFPNYL